MAMKTYRSSDGTVWHVHVEVPSHSSALIRFAYPAGGTGRRDRYAWLNARGPHVNDARSRLQPAATLESLNERELARLFRRSMPVETERPAYIVS